MSTATGESAELRAPNEDKLIVYHHAKTPIIFATSHSHSSQVSAAYIKPYVQSSPSDTPVAHRAVAHASSAAATTANIQVKNIVKLVVQ